MISTLYLVFHFLLITHGFPLGDSDSHLFQISVGHINDFHARFEQTSTSSSACKDDTCIGGIARLYTGVNMIKDQKNFVFFNAGDTFQGSSWYNVFKWNVTQYFMNMLPFDAITIGNHDFDDSISGIVPFIQHMLPVPTVVCNIDDSLEPYFQGTYNKSTVIIREGKKIGIIGVVTNTTGESSVPGKLKFLDESSSVNKEAMRLVEEEDVFTTFVISHCGYISDKYIAENLPPHSRVSLIVGGHSHSLLYTGIPPNNEKPEGPYPTVITQENGNKVLVVQASAFTKYLGNITIVYNQKGKPVHWAGNPIYLGRNISEDPFILEEIKPWKETLEVHGSKILGQTLVDLNIFKCYVAECIMGDFITDAYLAAWQNFEEKEEGAWSYVSIALCNPGGLRAEIVAGNITYNDMLMVQPFGNTINIAQLEGKYIKEGLEHAVSKSYYEILLPQVSGLEVVYDMRNPPGSRVISLKVRCQNCLEPVFEEFDPHKTYRVVMPSYITKGGDGLTAISDNLKNLRVGPVDIDFLEEHVPTLPPIIQELEERITVYGAPDYQQRLGGLMA